MRWAEFYIKSEIYDSFPLQLVKKNPRFITKHVQLGPNSEMHRSVLQPQVPHYFPFSALNIRSWR